MSNKTLNSENIKLYKQFLFEQEKSKSTIEKYIRDITAFQIFLSNRKINKKVLLEYKSKISLTHAPMSVNSMIAAINSFLSWSNKGDLKLKPLKIQKEIYSKPERELSQKEYMKLVKAAQKEGDERLSLLIQTICCTGIRVSELKFITAECLKNNRAIVSCKGKNRTVILPKEFCKELRIYCKKQNIRSGSIFLSRKQKPLDRFAIWKMMKKICDKAGVEKSKVFPHNLRHLFARTYYKINKDISRLADLLGHSNINTTRIYTIETGSTHEKHLDKMNLFLQKKITT